MRADLAAALEQLASVARAIRLRVKYRADAAAMTGDCSAGFISAQLPVTSAAAVMPVRIASGKIPRRDDRGDAARLVEINVGFAGQLLGLARRAQA